MAISGTVPQFDVSATPNSPETVVTVTGSQSVGLPDGTHSTESLPSTITRWCNLLSISGLLGDNGVTSGMQAFSDAMVSGVHQVQREMAFRVSDLEMQGSKQADRLTRAQDVIAASGELQWGA